MNYFVVLGGKENKEDESPLNRGRKMFKKRFRRFSPRFFLFAVNENVPLLRRGRWFPEEDYLLLSTLVSDSCSLNGIFWVEERD